MVRISKIDEKDKKIIEILEENARTPYTEIAKRLGITEAAVRKRIKKLEEFGIIRKYTIEVNNKVLGRKVAWIGLDVEPDSFVNIINRLKTLKVRRIYLSIGDHDLMLEHIYEKQDDLNQLVNVIENFPGVKRVCPAILVDLIV
jgi:Lrp/AsnC family transcriptional regulator for asnA, asnC and gidA